MALKLFIAESFSNINSKIIQKIPLLKYCMFYSFRYKSVMPLLRAELKAAESEWHPESQYRSAWNVMPWPWIQPCANFPLCWSSS